MRRWRGFPGPRPAVLSRGGLCPMLPAVGYGAPGGPGSELSAGPGSELSAAPGSSAATPSASTLSWRTTRHGRDLRRGPGGAARRPPVSPSPWPPSDTCEIGGGSRRRRCSSRSPHAHRHPRAAALSPRPPSVLTSPPRGSPTFSGASIWLMLRMTAHREMRGRRAAPSSPGLPSSSGGGEDAGGDGGRAPSSHCTAPSGSGARSAACGSQKLLCRLPRERRGHPPPRPHGVPIGGDPAGSASAPSGTPCCSPLPPRGTWPQRSRPAVPTWRSGCPGRSRAGA